MHIPFNKEIIENKTKRTIILFLITIFPILFSLGMYWLNRENNSLYKLIGSEDHLIEWLQFFLFGVSGVIAFILALKFRDVSKLMFVIFLIVSFGLIFVAGEEISWGQRIFNIEGSEIFDGEKEIPILKYNVQSETNIHNFKTIHSKIGYVYLVIGAYGCFAWFLVYIFKKIFNLKKDIKKFLPFFIPPPYLFFYFLPLGINLLPRMEWGITQKEYEMTEFLLSLGVFIFLLLLLGYFNKSFKQQDSKKE